MNWEISSILQNCSFFAETTLNYIYVYHRWTIILTSLFIILRDLSENRLTGRLPDTFGNLSSLREFWAEANSLSGTVPESYGNLTNLTVFSIAGNYISGPLPVYIVKRWGYIETLSLLGNNFKGNLTKEVFSLPNLRHLLISDLENATFELPSNITNTEFVSLILRNCSINGPIPRYIGDQMPSLKYLDLSFNNLTGGLPGFMKSQDLLYMSFSTNMLNGMIPAWILEAVQTRMRDPLDMMNTYCQGKEQKYHSLFINCGGGETVVNGIPYEQDNATSPFYTSPNKNWAYSTSGDFLVENANSSNYIQNMTCGISVAEAPLYDRARLSPVSLKYYAFCLREGKYNVSLKFAEIVYTEDTDYTSLRKREFDVYIQDDKVLHNFNIREQAGGPDIPTTKNFTAVVNKNNSLLMIHMYWDGKGSSEDSPTFNGPLISAISVTPDFKVHDEKLSPLRIALIAIASTIIAMLLLLAFAWSMGWLGSRNSYEIKVGEEKTDEGTQDIRVTLKELIDATGKFSKEKKIGDGSLGTVYKAQLQGQIDPDTRSVKFTWNTRLNICLGIARGLEYLHNHPRLNIAHLNIKADTILLDGNLEPKISDFRLAHLYAVVDHYKVIKREVSQGYMAPEYFHGILTSKADVYSFGVILLEIVSWKKNVIKSNDRTEVLVNTAHQKHERGNLEDMVDKTSGTYDTQQALTILKLAVKCTSIAPSVRPTMSDVDLLHLPVLCFLIIIQLASYLFSSPAASDIFESVLEYFGLLLPVDDTVSVRQLPSHVVYLPVCLNMSKASILGKL
ncbi:hypothetical protein M0R45_026015 [Rubus argutus]|uniref:non-specific serine/threonine protein kinase n=1 Tax=Rubus argutus TaxID=59490 RepID=A0AAW1WW46_RUBAR